MLTLLLAVPLPSVIAGLGVKENTELYDEKIILAPVVTGFNAAETAKLLPRLAVAGTVSVIVLLAAVDGLI